MFLITPAMISTFKSNWALTFQDQGLDVIAEGLDTLKDMAHDMNEVSVFLTFVFLPVAACVFVIVFTFVIYSMNTGTG